MTARSVGLVKAVGSGGSFSTAGDGAQMARQALGRSGIPGQAAAPVAAEPEEEKAEGRLEIKRPCYAGKGRKNPKNPNDWRLFVRANHACNNRHASGADLVAALAEFERTVAERKADGTWSPGMEDGTRKDVREIHLFDKDEEMRWLKCALLPTESADQKKMTLLTYEHGTDCDPAATWFKTVIEDKSVSRSDRRRFIMRSFAKNYDNGTYKDLPRAQETGFHVDHSTLGAPFHFWELLCEKM